MPADTPPPRRKWHFSRWLIVFILATLAWSGWRAYPFRSALAQAKAQGWQVEYADPVETIRKNWRAAFQKATWRDGVTLVGIPTSEAFEQHLAIVHRLNPKWMVIENAATLRDLSSLKPLTRLQRVGLIGCTGLANLDELKNHSALQLVNLGGSTALTNLDALKSLTALQKVDLSGCTGLTNIDALKNLSALQEVNLNDCTGLSNVDGLKNLPALQKVWLRGCTGLTNIDALKNLPVLQIAVIEGCTGLTKEGVAALTAALPNATVFGP